MNARKFTLIMSLTVAVVALPLGMGPARAQTGNASDTTVVDAAGRVHRVMPMRQLTPAQRKAAAERAKATRNAEAVNKNAAAPKSNGEVRK